MTKDEARKVAAIANSADNYCHVCAGNLCRELIAAFPEHAEIFLDTYNEEHA